ncbi:MAG: hypothetical protein ACE5I2_01395 [Anaerolineae bacterium]
MPVSNRELQALEIIHRYGGQTGYSTVAQAMRLGSDYGRIICRGLGEADYIDMTNQGLCIIKGKGLVELLRQGKVTIEEVTAQYEIPDLEVPDVRREAVPTAPPRPIQRKHVVKASLADQIVAHIVNFPGAKAAHVKALLGLSKNETEEVLQQLVQARKIRQKDDGLYYPA